MGGSFPRSLPCQFCLRKTRNRSQTCTFCRDRELCNIRLPAQPIRILIENYVNSVYAPPGIHNRTGPISGGIKCLAEISHVDERYIRKIKNGEIESVSLDKADKLLTALGSTYLLHWPQEIGGLGHERSSNA